VTQSLSFVSLAYSKSWTRVGFIKMISRREEERRALKRRFALLIWTWVFLLLARVWACERGGGR
jgi:hypothetical protein